MTLPIIIVIIILILLTAHRSQYIYMWWKYHTHTHALCACVYYLKCLMSECKWTEWTKKNRTQTWARLSYSFEYNHKNSRWKTNTHVKSTFHLLCEWVCLELVIVCSFIFDNFFLSRFVLSFVRWFAFFPSFVGGLIRLHQLSYCRNCFSVLWLINTHWPYVQIEYNKMYTHTQTAKAHTRSRARFDSIYLHWQIYSPLPLSSHIIFSSFLRLIPHWKWMGALSNVRAYTIELTQANVGGGAFNERTTHTHMCVYWIDS